MDRGRGAGGADVPGSGARTRSGAAGGQRGDDLWFRRLELAGTFGATTRHRVGAVPSNAFDVVIEVSGAAAAVGAALGALDVGGVLVLAGSVFPVGSVPLDPEAVVRGRHTLVGVHNYEPRHLDAAINLLATTNLPWDEVIAPPVALRELAELLTAPGARATLRRAVAPGI